MSAAFDRDVPIPTAMTVEEFLEWDPGDGRRWQLVDGVPMAMAPGKLTHGALQAEVTRLIGNHLSASGSPCYIIDAPGVVPRVRAKHNYRIPDLAVTCAPYDAAEEHFLDDPTLIIELLSPTNQHETWSAVWTYTSLPSVREIVVFRTLAIRAEVLRRQPDGTWPETMLDVTEGDLAFDSIGFRAPLASFYRTTRLAR